MKLQTRQHQRGLSLLEILVALTILAFSLGALYQAGAQNVANIGHLERRAYAMMIAESLLAMHDDVPVEGLGISGGSADDGFFWQLTSEPLEALVESSGVDVELDVWPFYRVRAQVSWSSRRQTHTVELITLLPEKGDQVQQ